MNYYELFGLAVSPRVNQEAVSKTYFALQRQFHPDHFTDATEFEKEESLSKSSLINNAYSIFRNEDKTLEYFLKTIGMLSDDEKYELPPVFLMEMMDLNEQAEEDLPGFKKKAESLDIRINDTIHQIINHYQDDGASEADLQKLKEYYFKKKYLSRILERLED